MLRARNADTAFASSTARRSHSNFEGLASDLLIGRVRGLAAVWTNSRFNDENLVDWVF
jgi:hypothetical protein